VTYAYTDPDGRHLDIHPDTNLDGQQVVTLWARGVCARVPVRIPLDRVEELIAGLRDNARQAALLPVPAGADCVHTAVVGDASR
jgi:hypothetical protein